MAFIFFGLRRYPTIVSSPAAREKGIAKIPDRMPCRLLSMTIPLSAAPCMKFGRNNIDLFIFKCEKLFSEN